MTITMNINQQQFSNQEVELIHKVINYTFFIGSTRICFKDIESKLVLDLTISEKTRNYTVDVKQLASAIKNIEEEISELKKENKHLQQITDSLLSKEKLTQEEHALWRRRSFLSDEIPRREMVKSHWEDVIKNNGIEQVDILGEFCSNKIFLYIKNIQKKCTSHLNGVPIYTKPLITTFIHEMFHAWNYFASNANERTVEEIDEALVECYTLLFLQEISKTMPEFKEILEYATGNIEGKQNSVGKLTVYGYGYFLFCCFNQTNNIKIKKMLEAYSKRSGNLNSHSNLVKTIQSKFANIYPKKKKIPFFTRSIK